MKKVLIAILTSTLVLFLLSLGMLQLAILFFPGLATEYFSPVFRTAGDNDWMYFAHPLVLSLSLKWFWEKYKNTLKGNLFLKAIELALIYGVVAMVPVLWLTFSAIDISMNMIITWLVYGCIQSFAAGIIFGKLNP